MIEVLHTSLRVACNTNRPLRVAMLVGSVSVNGGGVSEAVLSLTKALQARRGVSVDILSIEDDPAILREAGDLRFRLSRRVGPAAFGYAPGLVDELVRGDFDVVHVHGLWMYISVAAMRWAQRTGRPYIVSPHGMLDPWALKNSAAKKWIARKLFEDAHLRGAARIHALCGEEARAVRRAGLTGRLAIVPNGVCRPVDHVEQPVWRTRMRRNAKVLLFLGRVTPKKQVLELIQAWSEARGRGPWQLVIVGPMERSYEDQLRQAIETSCCAGSIYLAGPAYGDARSAAYAASDAFILPSLSEGLPMAALEAFSHSRPALLTQQCNLPESFEAGAALRIGTEPSAIAEGLSRLFSLKDAELAAMGQRAGRLASQRFDWGVVAEQFVKLYRELD